MIRKSVVLPAPEEPTNPATVPAGKRQLIPRSTSRPFQVRVTPRHSTQTLMVLNDIQATAGQHEVNPYWGGSQQEQQQRQARRHMRRPEMQESK